VLSRTEETWIDYRIYGDFSGSSKEAIDFIGSIDMKDPMVFYFNCRHFTAGMKKIMCQEPLNSSMRMYYPYDCTTDKITVEVQGKTEELTLND
jgi:hypothetical protein